MGKPSADHPRGGAGRLGVRAAETVMVGDRIETDVAMGKRSGLATILVLSGITRPDDPRIPGLAPDHVIRSDPEIFCR